MLFSFPGNIRALKTPKDTWILPFLALFPGSEQVIRLSHDKRNFLWSHTGMMALNGPECCNLEHKIQNFLWSKISILALYLLGFSAGSLMNTWIHGEDIRSNKLLIIWMASWLYSAIMWPDVELHFLNQSRIPGTEGLPRRCGCVLLVPDITVNSHSFQHVYLWDAPVTEHMDISKTLAKLARHKESRENISFDPPWWALP